MLKVLDYSAVYQIACTHFCHFVNLKTRPEFYSNILVNEPASVIGRAPARSLKDDLETDKIDCLPERVCTEARQRHFSPSEFIFFILIYCFM